MLLCRLSVADNLVYFGLLLLNPIYVHKVATDSGEHGERRLVNLVECSCICTQNLGQSELSHAGWDAIAAGRTYGMGVLFADPFEPNHVLAWLPQPN